MKTKFYKASYKEEECTFKRRDHSSYFKFVLHEFNYHLIFLGFLFLMNGTLKAQDFSKPNLAGTNKMNIALVKKDSGNITFYTLPGEPHIRMIMPKVSGNTKSNNSRTSSNKNDAALNSVLGVPTCMSAPLYPANGQTGVCPNYTISWPSVSGATGYQVYLGGENGTNPPYWMTRTDNSMTFYSPENYLVYWKIVPVNGDGAAAGCPLWTFTTGVYTRTSVQLNVSPGNPVCEGTPVTFTAIPTNGGSNPQYRWWNGYTNDPRFPQPKYIDGETGSTLTLNTLLNGDKIGVLILGDAAICTLGSSSEITMTVNPAAVWYKDADNDGYSDGSTQTQCEQPADYKLETELTATSGDCDDANAAINPATLWYLDADNDGYSNGATQTQCERPADYKLATELTAISGDCNDEDATVHAPQLYYVDDDHDGFGSTTTAMLCSSTAPLGYSTNSTDCNDADATVHTPQLYYVDADNDGFGSTTTAMLCSSTAPVGYSTNNTDCNDANVSVHAPQTYYRDADGDGYGSSVTTNVCSSTPPAGYSARTGDCNDNNPAINPGAVEVCSNGIDDNCNGQIDEQPCFVCQNATGFTTTNITATNARLNWNSVANPVQWQVQYKTTNLGAKWVDVLLTGDKRSVTISPLLAKQNYIWHIRAKCGKTWTAYSGSVSFKTLAASATFAVATSSISGTQPANSAIRLYPNPSKGQFVVELQIAEKINANVKIQIMDLAGKAVQAETAFMSNGSIKQSVNASPVLSNGIYMVRILVNNKAYITRLVYEK